MILNDEFGYSITGLIAARVCADYFQHVVIIEPDEGANTEFPATESRKDAHGNTSYVSKRSRVMQSFSLHRKYGHSIAHP